MLDIRELMNLKEAYAEVYAPQELTEEQVWEEVEYWVNSLLEEGYDLSDYTWEEMYESYLEEAGMDVFSTPAMKKAQVNQALSVFNPQKSKPKPDAITSFTNSPAVQKAQKGREVRAAQDLFGIKQKPVTKVNPTTPTAKPTPDTSTPAARPAAASAAAPKPAPAATTPAAKPSPMQQFAAANPKLAVSAAERDRTRGTSATTNPLMKDMKSRLPAPKTPSPSTAKTGFDLAKKGVNLAASFDMFDVVKGYLIGEGYADTEEAALAIMTNMSEEWRQSIIVESGKNDARIRGNIKSFGSNYTPPRDWDQSANRGQGAVLNAKQKEKQRRKGLRQEEYMDEAITSEKGKAKAAEMIAARSTPSGRAKSGKGANVAQIRQIRGSGRGSFDREGLGGTPMTPTMAKNPIKKQNYIGTGNKASRRAGTYKESFNIFVNSMIAEGVSMERYTWEEIQNVFDDLFEAEVANRDPDEYERKAKQGQSREQQLKGRVMGRMNQMDPDKKAAMLKQMRAAGLDV